MTSPKQARPPVKRALKLAPTQANLTGLTHVHSTRPKNQVELLTSPGSHAQTGEKSVRCPAAARVARPLTTLVVDTQFRTRLHQHKRCPAAIFRCVSAPEGDVTNSSHDNLTFVGYANDRFPRLVKAKT